MEQSCSTHDKTCSCSCHSCQVCHPEYEEHKHEDCASDFLAIADEAWMEVLKDKIKEHILATQNDRMTELAKIVSETNNQRWRNKMEKKHGCMEFKEKLSRFFGQT